MYNNCKLYEKQAIKVIPFPCHLFNMDNNGNNDRNGNNDKNGNNGNNGSIRNMRHHDRINMRKNK